MIKAALLAAIAPFLIAVGLGLIEHFTGRPRGIRIHLGTIDPVAPSPDAHVERPRSTHRERLG